MASSDDRTGANFDFNSYQFPQGQQSGDVQTVVVTLTGPPVQTLIGGHAGYEPIAFQQPIKIESALLWHRVVSSPIPLLPITVTASWPMAEQSCRILGR